MSLEEQHERLHRRGEMGKFLVLVVLLLMIVLAVAALRPLIFEGMVPAVMGWHEAPALPATATATASPTPADEEARPVIMTATPAPESLPTATSSPPATATPLVYEVQTGDTLADIAARFGVTIEAIVEANGLENPNRIQTGDVLRIPEP